MREWVSSLTWVEAGLLWCAASVVLGLLAGRLIRQGSEHDDEERGR